MSPAAFERYWHFKVRSWALPRAGVLSMRVSKSWLSCTASLLWQQPLLTSCMARDMFLLPEIAYQGYPMFRWYASLCRACAE